MALRICIQKNCLARVIEQPGELARHVGHEVIQFNEL